MEINRLAFKETKYGAYNIAISNGIDNKFNNGSACNLPISKQWKASNYALAMDYDKLKI